MRVYKSENLVRMVDLEVWLGGIEILYLFLNKNFLKDESVCLP